MPLKTVVKVGNITNLSDARYCSGMGVEMLGFSVIEGTPGYISPQVFQEIRGWISGPKIVAELYGLSKQPDLEGIIRSYAPDYFELSAAEYLENVLQFSLPCLVSATSMEVEMLDKYGEIEYLIIDANDLKASSRSAHPRLLRIRSKEKLWETITANNLSGVALTGSHEIRPGFKEYTELADVLELLED